MPTNHLWLSEGRNFATLQLNFPETAKDIWKTCNEFQVSAQRFADAGASQVFMLPG